jgi:predicted restriction endonuclease
MNLFFHHVGRIGAKQDFPKTIFKRLQLDKLIVDGLISDIALREKLKEKFPSGEFNCWGVPAGASSVIGNLQEGDYVFLVESSRVDGTVPVLCPVKIFWRYELRDLSEYLWQDSKYPYIFFFDTVDIDLMWPQFLENLDYKSNFSPRGNFYKISADRLSKFGGVNEYVYSILNTHSNYRGENIPTDTASEEPEKYNFLDVQYEEDTLVDLAKNEPSLTSGETKQKTATKVTKREQAFRVQVKKNYDSRCAVCNTSLKNPQGKAAVHAAHIYPKSKNGSDDLRNGICLCYIHHWSLDAGWLAISDDHKILIHKNMPRSKEYKIIYMYEGRKITLPRNKKFNPHPLFLTESRKLYDFQ